MNKLKILFQQTVMISAMVLLAIGLEGLVRHLAGYDMILEWYQPLSIVFTGFLGALPTLVWPFDRNLDRKPFVVLIVCHCMLLFAMVSLAGYLFNWYSNGREYLFVAIVYFVIYALVWVATLWLGRRDEVKINQAIKEIQDDE